MCERVSRTLLPCHLSPVRESVLCTLFTAVHAELASQRCALRVRTHSVGPTVGGPWCALCDINTLISNAQ